jgi:hypothetical protein
MQIQYTYRIISFSEISQILILSILKLLGHIHRVISFHTARNFFMATGENQR